jgi:hypothetical protein
VKSRELLLGCIEDPALTNGPPLLLLVASLLNVNNSSRVTTSSRMCLLVLVGGRLGNPSDIVKRLERSTSSSTLDVRPDVV